MASFKAHCAFGFWSGAEVLEGEMKDGAMGQLGRITSLKDLPPKKVLAGYVKKAMALKDAGVKPAWQKARKARDVFGAFPPSHKREYCAWIAEVKRPETRARRTAQAVQWIAEGKQRNWKYMEKR